MDSCLENLRRFHSAILIQGFRDLCKGNSTDQASVMRWIYTQGFEDVCQGAGRDSDLMRSKFVALKKMSPEIRRELFSEISRNVLGFQNQYRKQLRPGSED